MTLKLGHELIWDIFMFYGVMNRIENEGWLNLLSLPYITGVPENGFEFYTGAMRLVLFSRGRQLDRNCAAPGPLCFVAAD